MIPISQLIENNENKILEFEKGKASRVFIDISKPDFYKLYQSKLDLVLTRKHKKPMIFDIHKLVKDPIEQLFYYLRGVKEFKGNIQMGIFMNGDLGCGKTTMLRAFCEMINDFNLKIITGIHSKKLASELNAEKRIEDYEKIPLFVDDIGKEPKDVNNFGTIIKPIPDVFALRAEYGSWTFGTGNYSLKTYGEFYGETIKERFIELFNIMKIKGGSQRKEINI